MHYSKIKNHIINKKYYWIYSISIFLPLVIGYWNIVSGSSSFSFFLFLRSMPIWLLIFLLPVISIYYVVVNIYRCRSFLKFYNNYLKEYNAQFNRVLIEKESYRMQGHYQSHNATIQPSPKPTNVVCIETDDFLLFFFSIQYSGIFQMVLKPFVFMKTDKEFCIKDKTVNIIRDFETTETEENKAITFPNKDGIKKIIIQKQVT